MRDFADLFEVKEGRERRGGRTDGREVGLRARHGSIGHLHPNMPLSLPEWMTDAPTLETGYDTLRHTCGRAW